MQKHLTFSSLMLLSSFKHSHFIKEEDFFLIESTETFSVSNDNASSKKFLCQEIILTLF